MAVARKTFEYLDEQTFCYIFKGLVRPHLEYGAPIWNPHTVKLKELIENVQRRATKTVPGLKDLSYEERLKKLKLPTLAYRRMRGDMITVFKLLNEGYDMSLPSILTPNTNSLRGHGDKLFQKRGDKGVRKYFFTHRVTKIWNSLPDNIIKSKDVWEFEKGLDSHWHNQELLYNFRADIEIKKTKHGAW